MTGADIYVTDNWLGMNIDYGEVLHQVYALTRPRAQVSTPWACWGSTA